MSIEEKAKELIRESGATDHIKETINKMFSSLGLDISFTEEEANRLAELCVPAYVKNFTEKEIDDAIAWHVSESGRAMTEKRMLVAEEIQAASQDTISKMIESKLQ